MDNIIEITLAGRAIALIDAADEHIVSPYKWYLLQSKDGRRYATATRSRATGFRMHRLILAAPDGMLVDHRDGNGLNNQRSNLRLATTVQNTRNRTRLAPNNTSGVCGVYYDKREAALYTRWCAHICIDGKIKFLGRFMTLEEAASVRRAAELRYFGEFAPTR